MEWMEKYRDAPREATASTIDMPMVIFLGLTITDLVVGVAVFIAVMVAWDAALSIPVGLGGGGLSAWLSRGYRRHLPPRFLQHWAWSVGQNSLRPMPVIFRRRRHVDFGP